MVRCVDCARFVPNKRPGLRGECKLILPSFMLTGTTADPRYPAAGGGCDLGVPLEVQP